MIEGISEALSFEMAEIGVKVKIVEPGAVRTNFNFVLMMTRAFPNIRKCSERSRSFRRV